MDTAAAAPDVYAPAQLAQLQQDLESATRSKPATLTASRLCLDQLATSAAAAGRRRGSSRCRPREPIEVVGSAPSPGNVEMPSMS